MVLTDRQFSAKLSATAVSAQNEISPEKKPKPCTNFHFQTSRRSKNPDPISDPNQIMWERINS